MSAVRMRNRIVAGLLALTVVGGLAACSKPSLATLPAPHAVTGPTYRVTADFRDVLNLPIGAKVKQAGVVVGDVRKIDTRNFVATVTMRISTKVALLQGTTAQIRFTTPLGEDYVALTSPRGSGRPALADGAHLAVTSTSAAPTIEDAFAALSLLINGGGLSQIGTIVNELNRALHGRADSARSVITNLDSLVRQLNAHRSDIHKALDGLHRLSTRLAAGSTVIDRALAAFPPALEVLATQTDDLTDLLQRVSRLGTVVNDALDAGTATLLRDLDLLRPALKTLTGMRSRLVPTMQSLVAFGNVVDEAVPGDYLNAVGTITLVFSDAVILPESQSAPASGSAHDSITQLLGGGGS